VIVSSVMRRSREALRGTLGIRLQIVLAIALPLLAGVGFSVWFSIEQARAVAPDFASHVPVGAYVPTVVEAFASCVCVFMISLLAIPRHRPLLGAALARAAAFFIAVLACAVSLAGAAILFVLAVAGLRFWEAGAAAEPAQWLARTGKRLFPLTAIAVVYSFLLPSVSPWDLDVAAVRSKETLMAAYSLAMRSHVNGYHFSFSPFIASYWGAMQDEPTGLVSLPMSLISFLKIFPLWEASAFFKSLSLIIFCAYVLGAYFLYLVLRDCGIRPLISLVAALCFIAGNKPFLYVLQVDGAWFLMQYLALPPAIYALRVALRDGSIGAACCAGLAMASPFYILEPHPEATIYAAAVAGVIGAAHIALPEAGRGRASAILMCAVAAGFFLLASAAYMGPMLANVLNGSFAVVGEISDVGARYRLPLSLAETALLLVGAFLELGRLRAEGRANPFFLGCLAVGCAVVPFGFPGVSASVYNLVRDTTGWKMHLWPPDRILTWLSFSAMVVGAFGVEAAAKLAARLRWPTRSTALRSAAAVALGLIGFVAVVTWNSGPVLHAMVLERHRRPVYESLDAALANSLTPEDQIASVPYFRRRLVESERLMSNHPLDPAWQAYRALLPPGYSSARDLPNASVRPLAAAAAPIIDDAYARLTQPDAPGAFNIDAYLASLDDPYQRVMAFFRPDRPFWFWGAARNVPNAHNNSIMYHTWGYVGFPMVHALYVFPADKPARFGHWIEVAPGYRSKTADRPVQWLHPPEELVDNPDFRRLLNIAGVGTYLVQENERFSRALGRADSGLRLLPSHAMSSTAGFELVRDERAYSTAYLARVVGSADPAAIAKVERDTRALYVKPDIDADEADAYAREIAPIRQSLLDMKDRHDAILAPPFNSLVPVDVAGLESAENPARRGGSVRIDGTAGPRIGLWVSCPDPTCVLVYNLAALPGWSSYVDQNAAPVFRANYAFLAVEVPRGLHYVAFVYRDLGEVAWTQCTLLSVLVWLGWTVLVRARRT